MRPVYFQDFDPEAAILPPMRSLEINSTFPLLLLQGDLLFGNVFAQDGPIGGKAASCIIAPDELELGRKLILCPLFFVILSRAK